MYQYRRLTKYEDIINKEGSVLQLAILFYSSLFTLYSPSINNDDTRQQDTKRTTIKIQNCSSSKEFAFLFSAFFYFVKI